ncbi:class II fructose-bisphosphatase [Proteinivorax tanatarense]|uniref:Fructose-1,6-bisphosphatase n=1 Tax=Proteinivorax tanatarense TaxID=1260629 RepID=A0AAU7VL08_9FIRM
MERELALEFVRVTEAAALASARLMGRGNKNEADQAAVSAMRAMFDTVQMEGKVMIGEGEKDEAPMLYIGEKLGAGNGPKLDVAVDPVEGTNLVAKGLPNALAVLAIAPEGCLLHAPEAYYMNKIATGPIGRDVISIELSATENLNRLADAMQKDVSDLVAVILDRPRHKNLIQEVREAGARVKLITDGDVAAAVAAAQPNSSVDIAMGIGGAPEGVLAAAALKCLGGKMEGRLLPIDPSKFKSKEEINWDAHKGEPILTMDDLAKGDDVIFAATGITDGGMLRGVRFTKEIAQTQSVVMRSQTGTVRTVDANHRLDKKPEVFQKLVGYKK